MDELRQLIEQYDAYYEMYDDHALWRRGCQTDRRIRSLAERLRAEGYGAEIDALMELHPNLVSCPDGVHALA